VPYQVSRTCRPDGATSFAELRIRAMAREAGDAVTCIALQVSSSDSQALDHKARTPAGKGRVLLRHVATSREQPLGYVTPDFRALCRAAPLPLVWHKLGHPWAA
jgi:hypothetical protein